MRLLTRFRRKVLKISDRDLVIRALPRESVGVEIGVWRGEFSARLRESVQPLYLHLVDPWRFQPSRPGSWYGGREVGSQTDMDAIHDAVAAKFRDDARVVIHREPSDEYWAKTEERSLDWAYIDGLHTYDAVTTDLRGALRCVKPGGVIAGDDYNVKRDGERPVKRAVRDFVASHGLGRGLRLIGGQFLIAV